MNPHAGRNDAAALRGISDTTIAYYDRSAQTYWDGTRDHDVSQNTAALLDAIEGYPPYSILDLGCGPGRDLPDGRYGCFFDLDTCRTNLRAVGFLELRNYFRPPGLPRDRQPWLATVWRRSSAAKR